MTAVTVTPRSGPGYWLRGYVEMMRFELASQRFLLLPVLLVVQALLGAGMAVIYGFYLGDGMTPDQATYLAGGIPALALVPVGFVAAPVIVADQRAKGCYDFIWALPVPRLAAAAATFSVFTVLALPGTVLALAVAVWRYDASLRISPMVVVAVLLSGLMSVSVGFALAHSITDARVTNSITNLVIVGAVMLSPIVVPLDHLPGWLAAVDRWLPLYHMAAVIRGSLVAGAEPGAFSWLVLVAWTVASWLVAMAIVGRRR